MRSRDVRAAAAAATAFACLACLAGAASCHGDTFTGAESDGGPGADSQADGQKGQDAAATDTSADAPPASPCATGQHVFCDDFDTPLDPWTTMDETPDAGATPGRSPAAFVSPPRSAVFPQPTPVASADVEWHYLEHELPSALPHLALSFELRFDAYSPTTMSVLTVIALYDGRRDLFVAVHGAKVGIGDVDADGNTNPSAFQPFFDVPPDKTFVHVRLDAVETADGAASGTLTVTTRGVPGAATATFSLPSRSAAIAPPRLDVGLHYVSGVQPFTMYVDDVVVDGL